MMIPAEICTKKYVKEISNGLFAHVNVSNNSIEVTFMPDGEKGYNWPSRSIARVMVFAAVENSTDPLTPNCAEEIKWKGQPTDEMTVFLEEVKSEMTELQYAVEEYKAENPAGAESNPFENLRANALQAKLNQLAIDKEERDLYGGLTRQEYEDEL